MKRHAASRQKPVPNLVSTLSVGTGLAPLPTIKVGVNFSAVIGTTTSLKSLVCSTVEEGGIVRGLGEASWAAATGDRQEHTIKIVMTWRKIIRCLPTLNSVGSDALHALFHKLSNQYKGFGVIGDDDWTKLEQLREKQTVTGRDGKTNSPCGEYQVRYRPYVIYCTW